MVKCCRGSVSCSGLGSGVLRFVLNRIQSRVSLDQIWCLERSLREVRVKDGESDIRVQYDIAL